MGHPVDHQVAHGHVLDRVREVARHGTLIVVAINRQCDDFAGIDRAIGLAPNRTRDGGGRNQDFLVVNDVVGGNRVDADMRCKRIGADRAGYAGTVGAARNVMTANRGRDRLILNCAAQHVDAVVAVGVHRAGADLGRADHQRDSVARLGVAADVAADRDLLVHFDVVDDVVGSDRVDRDGGAGGI